MKLYFNPSELSPQLVFRSQSLVFFGCCFIISLSFLNAWSQISNSVPLFWLHSEQPSFSLLTSMSIHWLCSASLSNFPPDTYECHIYPKLHPLCSSHLYRVSGPQPSTALFVSLWLLTSLKTTCYFLTFLIFLSYWMWPDLATHYWCFDALPSHIYHSWWELLVAKSAINTLFIVPSSK